MLFLISDSQQKGKSNKKNKKKKRTKTLNRDITQAQAEQQLFNGYYKVSSNYYCGGKKFHPISTKEQLPLTSNH